MGYKQWIVIVIEMVFLGIGTWFDVKEQKLPVPFLNIFIVLAAAINLMLGLQNLWSSFLGAVVGSLFLMIAWLSKEAIGYGDGWVLMILGILEGAAGILQILTGAFFLSGVYGLWKLIGLKGKRGETMPFVPFLLIARLGVLVL